MRARFQSASASPSSIDAVGPLCLAYHADMLYDEAERCYGIAGALATDDWQWSYRRAVIQAERGGGEALLTNLRAVTALANGHAPAWLMLGDAEFKAGRYDAAAAAWQRARDLPEPAAAAGAPSRVVEIPVRAFASLGLARIEITRQAPDAARTLLEGAVADVPQFGPAHRLLAEVYRSLGREEDARRAIYRASRLPPYSPYMDPLLDGVARESRNSVLLLRLASEANLGLNAEWSEFLTRRALEVDPDNPEVVAKLGRVLRARGRNDEALTRFQRYAQLVPGDYQGLGQVGSTLSALGRFAEAEPYLRRAATGLDDPVSHFNLGLLFAVTGRIDAAVGEYRTALDRDARHSDARINLATVLAKQGRVDQAMRELETVVGFDPENVAARTNLGLLLIQRGAPDRARGHLAEAVRLDPSLAVAAQALASIGGGDVR